MKLSIDFLYRNFSLDKRRLNINEDISIQLQYISSFKTFIEQRFKFSVSNKTFFLKYQVTHICALHV